MDWLQFIEYEQKSPYCRLRSADPLKRVSCDGYVLAGPERLLDDLTADSDRRPN